MFRLIPVLVLLFFIAACSKTPAKEAAAATPAQAGAEAQEAVKPLPPQLPDVLARVNGENVTKTEVEDYIKNMEAQAGAPLPPDQRDRVYRGVIDQMVGYKLLLQEVASRKIAVPDADVDARINEVKKQFPSEDMFMQALISRNLTLDKMKVDARRDIGVSKLIEQEIAAKVAVKPEQVESFYKENPDKFKQPEQVRASHILIKFPESVDDAGKAAVARAQAKMKAEQILKDIKAGKDFAALAKQHSDDPGSAVNGGDLGVFPQGQMVGPFNDVAFRLKPGETSDLVETQFGYHIIRVAEKQEGRTIPLEEMRTRIEEFLKHRSKETETEAFVKSLRSKAKVELLV